MIDTVVHNPKPASTAQRSWLQRTARNQTWFAAIGALVLLFVLYAAGACCVIDRALMDIRFKLLSHPASGEVVLISFDEKSRAEMLASTPTRSQHAKILKQLSDAGARRIGFDFQLDRPTDEMNDVALVNALRLTSGRVVFPTYTMRAPSFASGEMLHEPLPAFAEHVKTGSVNLATSDDGLIRDYQLIHTSEGGLIPSFAGSVVQINMPDQSSFVLDYSIDMKAIRSFSYIDVMNGLVPSFAFDGKIVFVGESGAVHAEVLETPLGRAFSGIEIQALAAEAMIQGRLLEFIPPPTDLALAILVLIVLTLVLLSLSGAVGIAVAVGSALAIVGIAALFDLAYMTLIPIGPTFIGIVLACLIALFARLNSKSRGLLKTALEAHERSTLMSSIVTTNFDGVVVFDERDHVYFINPTAAKMLNWSIEGALGREREALLTLPDDFAMPSENSHVTETVITRADGNQLDVELAITQSVLSPLESRHERRKRARTYHIYTFRDISVRKKAEKTMAEATERAVEADNLKSKFIANMSHELRAPLSSIIGFSEVIKQELYGSVGSPQYKGYAEDIFASGTHLMSIIDDLIEVSQIAAGKVELNDTEIDMERMFAECLQTVRAYPDASRKVISANMRPGCPNLIADNRALKQILINLLSNAIKFTREGDGIRLSAAPSIDGGVEIMVSDDGIGIPPEEMDRISNAFHQIDREAHRENAGTGLGLHIVQSLAELHGATVAVTSTVNSGTQVRVAFPPERNQIASNVIPLEREKNAG